MAAKWRVLTDVREIKRLVNAGLASYNTKAPAIPEWSDDKNAGRAALNGCLYVLEEHDDDEE
jgi:hypothetical protein